MCEYKKTEKVLKWVADAIVISFAIYGACKLGAVYPNKVEAAVLFLFLVLGFYYHTIDLNTKYREKHNKSIDKLD